MRREANVTFLGEDREAQASQIIFLQGIAFQYDPSIVLRLTYGNRQLSLLGLCCATFAAQPQRLVARGTPVLLILGTMISLVE